jgi:hypothetical protein
VVDDSLFSTDHWVGGIVFDKANRRLPPDQMVWEINGRPGLLPIDVDLEREELVWFDIGEHQLTESFFFVSTEKLIARQKQPELFGTGVELLIADDLSVDALYPSGFIFHMGRCGSTLLSRALARARENNVISEAPPHFFIWPLLTGGWLRPPGVSDETTRVFRNLILTMGRRRRSDQRAHFVKFTTYTVLFIEFITRVFPNVPCLFLYRDPVEVVVSLLRQGPGWEAMKGTEFGALTTGESISKTKSMSRLEYIERYLVRFLSTVLSASVDLMVLNYSQLNRTSFPAVLEAMNWRATDDQIPLMRKQFDHYSKSELGDVDFTSDMADKRDSVTPAIRRAVAGELQGLYDQLERSGSNLARTLP